MRRALALVGAILALSVAGCDAPEPDKAELPEISDAEINQTIADLDNTVNSLAEARASAEKAVSEPAPANNPEPRYEPECWQDYCPCNDHDGPMGADLCRRQRAGLPISDSQYAEAAKWADLTRRGRAVSEEIQSYDFSPEPY